MRAAIDGTLRSTKENKTGFVALVLLPYAAPWGEASVAFYNGPGLHSACRRQPISVRVRCPPFPVAVAELYGTIAQTA